VVCETSNDGVLLPLAGPESLCGAEALLRLKSILCWGTTGCGARNQVQRSFVGHLRFAKMPLPQDDSGVGAADTDPAGDFAATVRGRNLLLRGADRLFWCGQKADSSLRSE
jgi:hypothetical protein